MPAQLQSGLSSKKFRLAIILNPVAGLGGPAGLKGSDAPDTPRLAAERGVQPQVYAKLGRVLEKLSEYSEKIELIAPDYPMGPMDVNGWKIERCLVPSVITSAQDTKNAVGKILSLKPDLILFAGGDGTARDVCSVLGHKTPVLGLPAGVKMHSGVFAVSPEAAASVIGSLIAGRLVAANLAEVRDIDETAFAQGKVKTQHYGEMLVPDDQILVQKVKCSGIPDDELLLEELSVYLSELIEDDSDALWILGSGGTMSAVKAKLGIEEPTLLGVDLWSKGQLLAKDVYEDELWKFLQQSEKPSRMMLSVIGGQGIVFGRGNQQLSPRVIQSCGLKNLYFVSTTEKLKALEGRPLSVDSGSAELDRDLAGYHKVICGFEETVLYPLNTFED